MSKKEITLIDVKKRIDEEASKNKDFGSKYGEMTYLGEEGLKIKDNVYEMNRFAFNNLLYKLKLQKTTVMQFDDKFRVKMINERLQNLSAEECYVRAKENRLRALFSENYVKYDHQDLIRDLSASNLIDSYFVKRFSIDDYSMKLDLVKKSEKQNVGLLEDGRLDEFEYGFSTSNSEIGLYSLNISSFLYRLICTNGAIARDELFSIKQKHYGANNVNFSDRVGRLGETTTKLFDKLKVLKESTITQANDEFFKTFFDGLRKRDKSFYASKKLREVVANNYETEKKLTGDNYYTLFNALTRTARDEENVDKKIILERVAGTFATQ